MAGPIVIAVRGDVAQANAALDSVGDKASRMGGIVRGAGRVAAAGLAVAGGAAVAIGVATAKAASDAQQSLGATETVYGRYADTVVKRSNHAAAAIGLSANEYRELSNVVGASLAGAGVPLKEVADLTGDLNQRAADMAATFGGTTREAIESISSALRGETDPIERYGVSLKQSDVNARLAAKGLDKLEGSALKQAEMQARLDLLFQKTKGSAGAFGKESDTLAGQQQRLAAKTENLKAKIGTALLPALTDVYSALNTKVVPVVRDAADKYLPKLSSAISGLVNGGASDKVEDLGASLAGVDWEKTADGAQATGEAVLEISKAVGQAGLEGLGSTLEVTGVAMGFVADHSDELAAAMPFLIAGFVALKIATAAGKVAALAAIPIRIAEAAATRQQTVAVRALTVAVQQMTAAQAGSAGAGANMIRTQAGTYSAVRQTTAAAQTQTRTVSALGATAKSAAGIGGIMALTSGLSEAKEEGNSFSSVIKGAAGGAGIGAMFGPVGALVGAAAGGGLTALVGSFKETAEEAETARVELLRTEGFQDAKTDADKLRESLGGVANAYGETSRAAVQASFTGEDGKVDADIQNLRDLGVSMDTIVSATLGQADAQARVDDALSGTVGNLQVKADEAKTAYNEMYEAIRTSQNLPVGANLDAIDALDPYREAVAETSSKLEEATALQDAFGAKVTETAGALSDHRAKLQGLASDLGITVEQYKKYPKKVRTDFETNGLRETGSDTLRLLEQYKGLRGFRNIKAVVSAPGVDLTARQVGKLTDRYRLTPKQVRTLFRTEGIDASTKGARKILDGIKSVDKVKVTAPGVRQGVEKATREGENAAKRGGEAISKAVEKPVRETRADLSGVRSSTVSGLSSAESAGRTGGVGIGTAIKQGFTSGFAGADGLWSSSVRSAVASAIAAGRAQARANSPSKETEDLGRDMGDGLPKGMAQREADAKRGGRNLVAAALAGIAGGGSAIESGLGKVADLIEKSLDAELRARQKVLRERLKGRELDRALERAEKASEARRRAIVKGLKAEFTQLRANGREQDRVNDRLKVANDELKTRVDQSAAYAANIRTAFQGFGSVVGLGAIEATDGKAGTDLDALVKDLELRKVQAQRFETLINELRDRKLSQTQIQALLDAGVEGGLATAEALAGGTQATIDKITSLTNDIDKAGTRLGNTSADALYAGGIKIAQGTVRGLEQEAAQLDKAGRRIGRAIVAELAAAEVGKPGRKSRDNADRYAATQTFSGRSAAGPSRPDVIELAIEFRDVDEVKQGKKYIRRIDLARGQGARSEKLVFKG